MTRLNMLGWVVLAWCGAFAGEHWNGGRVAPVHRLAPRDFDDERVSVSASLPTPISQAKTCGQCHDVAALHGGSHFRTGLDTNDAPVSVQVEPWFWVNETLGLAVPLSLHGQPGTYAPRELGLSCWQWTKMFGRAFPGGGVGADPRALAEEAGARQRWFVTGPLEANCLACHHQGPEYDVSEWARQVARENFTGAASAASGLALVEGMNERMGAAWAAAENPDDHLFNVPQKMVYDLTRFDAKGRCVFPVGKPQNERCLACHSVSEKGMPSHAIAGDVHLARGLRCIDCHVNGMDHRVKTTSCRTCHEESEGAGPKPVHAGIPLVHFQKLTCTVCHSGVTSGGARAVVRTSRANRIGLYGRAQWATDYPSILEPVFAKGADGKIAPCRVMWPSYFAKRGQDGSVAPLAPDALGDVAALQGTNGLTRARVAAALAELKARGRKESFVFIGHGKMWSLEGTNLTMAAHRAADPVFWPVGHDVRPARQARGASPVKCASCHTADSDFFQAKIVPTGPLADAEVEPVAQAELMGVGAGFHAVLGATFALRPLLKAFMWTVFGLLGLFAAAAAAVVLPACAGWISARTDDFIWGLAKWLLDVVFVLCLLYLAASGLIGWLIGGMAGVWLVLHMCAGGGLTACLAALVCIRVKERTKKPGMGLIWLAWTVLAAGVVFTAVMPMMTVFGEAGQLVLLWSHRLLSVAFVAVSALLCVRCARQRGC